MAGPEPASEKGGGAKTKKLRKRFATLYVYDCAARNFEKKAVKSTIFKLEQSFLHIFGVAQNFQLNGGGFWLKRGGGLTLSFVNHGISR